MSNDTFDAATKTTPTFFKTLFVSMSLLALSSAWAYAAQQASPSDGVVEQKLFIQDSKLGDSLQSSDGRVVRSNEARPLTITPSNETDWTPGDWATTYAYKCDLLKNACLVNVEGGGVTRSDLSFDDVLKNYSDTFIENRWKHEIAVKYASVLMAKTTVELIVRSGGDFDPAAYMKALAAYQEAGQNLYKSSQECEKDIPGSIACQWPEYPYLPQLALRQ